MKTNWATTALVALSSTLSAVADEGQDHFILTDLWPLAIARADSIISPGTIGGHAHSLIGGSLVGKDPLSAEQLQTAACTSCIVGADKSNYWSPQLFWRYENDTYEPMLVQNRIYYYLKGDTQPFPPGLRMISGISQTRNASAVESVGLLISCDHGQQSKYIPNGITYPDGCSTITLGIFYPSCGLADGTTDSADHFSHMAWPITWNGTWFNDPNGVTCPDSHPIKYPTIFMENNYHVSGNQVWRSGDEAILVLANGDTTGLAYHADYAYGWDQEVLTQTIKECGDGHGPGDQLATCAPLAASLSISNAWNCRLERVIPDEDMGLYEPLTSLPGCNPLWTADMPDVHPTCDTAPPTPRWISPNVYFENLQYREHIPMAFTLAENASDLANFTPSIGGGLGYSSLLWWADQVGDDGVKPKIQSSTTEEVIAARDGSGVSTGSDIKDPVAVEASGADSTSKISATSTSASAVKSSKSASSTSVSPTSISKSASAAASTSSGVKVPAGGIVAVVDGHSSAGSSVRTSTRTAHPDTTTSSIPINSTVSGSESAAAVTTAATSAKTCHRKKRGLDAVLAEQHERSQYIPKGLVGHAHRRRHQRSAFGH